MLVALLVAAVAIYFAVTFPNLMVDKPGTSGSFAAGLDCFAWIILCVGVGTMKLPFYLMELLFVFALAQSIIQALEARGMKNVRRERYRWVGASIALLLMVEYTAVSASLPRSDGVPPFSQLFLFSA